MSSKKTTARKKSHSKNRKTQKLVKKDKKKCENTKCKEWLKDAAKIDANMIKEEEKRYNELIQTEKKVCSSNSNKSDECEEIKRNIKYSKKELNSLKNQKKRQKYVLLKCKEGLCNIGCKGTIVEDGNPTLLPTSLSKTYKKSKAAIDFLKKTRKEIFGKKTSVLHDDFYEGLDPNYVKKLKKEGAISGCFLR